MMQGAAGSSRPIDLTDNQVEALALGISTEVGEPSRPKNLRDEDVEKLVSGQDVHIENFPTLERLTAAAERSVSRSGQTGQTRPRLVTDADVEALAAGQDIDLQGRESIRSQN
jgi:hypothetical protein